MKVRIRRGTNTDIDSVYVLHTKCFCSGDLWYRSNILEYLVDSLIVELLKPNESPVIIGVLLQGPVIPSAQSAHPAHPVQPVQTAQSAHPAQSVQTAQPAQPAQSAQPAQPAQSAQTINFQSDEEFEPITSIGFQMKSTYSHLKPIYGILMLCIDPNYRNKGLGRKLIGKHLNLMTESIPMVCLHTRKSNVKAFILYKKMGYEHIGWVRNKYILPNEDSMFMIKLNDSVKI
jgi:ribosomal protein S18 acetylase RimI-like enzyme